jgi:pimeloyl-ACP methyl ester carboxylesterase
MGVRWPVFALDPDDRKGQAMMIASILCLSLTLGMTVAQVRGEPPDGRSPAVVEYRTAEVEGLKIFYREAGAKDAPVILLLHGFPSSSRMFDAVLPALGKRYHVIAPDYPGFGHSDAPDAKSFAYTFDHLASVIQKFTEQLGLSHYTLLLQDYGGPVGFRIALKHPERVHGIIIQNAVSHEVGLSPLWEARRAFWRDRKENEQAFRAKFFSLDSTRQRHVGTDPHPENIDPDTWTDEFAFLNRPGEADIQSDLFYDYRTNVENYPKWQQYLRERQPPMLVVWGRYDPSFTVEGAQAYAKDVPSVEVHLLDAGHFALDQKSAVIIQLVDTFMATKVAKYSGE